MRRSVKTLWLGAAVCFVYAVGFLVYDILWLAAAFALPVPVLAASALLHARACRRIERELEAREADMREALELATEQKEQALVQCKQDIAHFHSVISHGLRIPISIILGYAELIRRDMVPDEAVRNEYLQKICDKVIYINELLGQMLLEMRTETGMTTVIKKPIEMLALLNKIASDVGDAAARRGIDLRVVSEADEIFIMGNTTGLTKAFYNILENSLKYIDGAGNINITVSKINENETLLVFKDDGAGLDEEQTAHIFELNYQGSNSVGGNGLGLYLVKTEIEAHGGTVYAKSSVGKGMGIYVTLPMAEQHELATV